MEKHDVASDSSDSSTRAGKLAASVLTVDLITINVLTSLRGYYRYKAVYAFMALGLLSKQDANDLFLDPAEVHYGQGGLKLLMQTCSAVLKLIRYEDGWLYCEKSEDVLRGSVLRNPQEAWVTLAKVVQLGLDPSIVNAMVASYKIDVSIKAPYRVIRPGVKTHRPDLGVFDHAVTVGHFDVADVLVHHGAPLTAAPLCHMATVESPKLHPFDDNLERFGNVVDYLMSRGVSLDAPIGDESPVADSNPLGFIAYVSTGVENTSPLLVARAVLNRGADVNAPGCHGLPPILWAIRYWNLPFVRLLLEHGAEIPRTVAYPGANDVVPSSHLIFSELVTPSYVTDDCDVVDAHRPFEILKLLVDHRVEINDPYNDDPSGSTLTAILYQMSKYGTPTPTNGDQGPGETHLGQKYRTCAHDLCELILRHIVSL